MKVHKQGETYSYVSFGATPYTSYYTVCGLNVHRDSNLETVETWRGIPKKKRCLNCLKRKEKG